MTRLWRRFDPSGTHRLTPKHVALAALTAFLGVPLICAFIALSGFQLKGTVPALPAISAVMFFGIGSGYWSWLGFLIAAPLFYILHRMDHAGWLLTALIGAVIGFLTARIMGGPFRGNALIVIPMFAMFGLAHAMIFWAALRLYTHPKSAV